MKKRLTFALATALVLSIFSIHADAQDRKELREKRRATQLKLEVADINQMLNQKAFFFQAQFLSWSDNPDYQNITLNQNNYGLWVYPKSINVMLPVYGGTAWMNPQLNQSLSYTTSHFTYKVSYNQNPQRPEWTVNISSLNLWTLNSYDYNLKIGPDGYATLILSNPFISEIIFTGLVQPQ